MGGVARYKLGDIKICKSTQRSPPCPPGRSQKAVRLARASFPALQGWGSTILWFSGSPEVAWVKG